MKRVTLSVLFVAAVAMVWINGDGQKVSRPSRELLFSRLGSGGAVFAGAGRPSDSWTELFTPENRSLPFTGRAANLMPGGWLAELSMQRLPEVAACFAEGTSPELVDYYSQMLAGHASPLAYFLGGRWPGAQGEPLTLTWSFMPDGVSIPSGVGEPAGGSTLFATLNTQFSGNTAQWIGLFEQSFARWEEVTGVTYVRVTDGVNEWDDGAGWGNPGTATHGEVRIGMKFIDGGSGSNILAYNYFPGSGGDMVFDASNAWSDSTNNFRFLRNVILHEHGHGLGMFHVCPAPTGQFPEPPGVRTKLMEPFLATNFDGPQHDDIRAGQRHYGDPFEDDDDPGSATDVGTLAHNAPLTVGAVPAPVVNNGSILSIDGDGDEDYFLFTVSASSSLTVTITPRGLNYDSSPQTGGNCTSGNFINSLFIADLNSELLDSDGVTVLTAAAAQPLGGTESMFFPSLDAGSYYVRVFEGDAPAQPQLYQLTLAAAPPTPFPAVAEPSGLVKNRYISFAPNNPGSTAAFRVTKTTAPAESCYVGPPDGQGNALCLSAPTFRVWTEAVINVGDCEIVPVASYEVRSTFDGTTFSPPLAVSTIPLPSNNGKLWGDVTGAFNGVEWPAPDQFTNVNDIIAVLSRISGVAAILPSFTQVNVQAVSSADPCLNALVNTADLFAIVKAVAGDPYPFTNDPASCPVCP